MRWVDAIVHQDQSNVKVWGFGLRSFLTGRRFLVEPFEQ